MTRSDQEWFCQLVWLAVMAIVEATDGNMQILRASWKSEFDKHASLSIYQKPS
jgi:hypothetical protein